MAYKLSSSRPNRAAQLTLASNKEQQSLQSSKQMELNGLGKTAFNLVKEENWTNKYKKRLWHTYGKSA